MTAHDLTDATAWAHTYTSLTIVNPELARAMDHAGEVFEIIGDAQRRATEAITEGRVQYTHSLGYAQRNLLELWLTYAAFTRRHFSAEIPGARKWLRKAIAQYRVLDERERSGIHGRLS